MQRRHDLALGTIFFLSGALALVYEVAWFRRLHLALGVSSFAAGAVLSAFMLGLALGSRWASRSPRLRRSPLAAYAALELGIALYALAFPTLVEGVESLYPALFRLLEGHDLGLAAARFGLAFGLLLLPTSLMGATLPAIAAAVEAPADRLAGRVAGLYALNTIGGMAGTLAAGFFLLEHLGLVGTLRAGAAGGLLIAAAALTLGRAGTRSATPEAVAAAEPAGMHRKKRRPAAATAAMPAPGAPAALATAAALAAGLVSLAGEVVWTRALVFFVHNSTYAFSAIVATYLLAIALGAGLAARLASSERTALRLLAGALLASTASLLLAIAVYRQLPTLAGLLAGGQPLAPGVTGSAAANALLVWSWSRALVIIFGQVAAVLLLPALCLGAVFPIALRLATRGDGPAAQWVGRLYAWNAAGSVGGAVLGTFALVPLFGTRGALLLLAWLPVPLALWALREARAPRRLPAWAAAALLGALAAASLLAAPAGFYRELFEARFGRVLWFAEGMSETVAVCEYKDGSRWIQFSDGRGASGTWSFPGGWLYAHLPLLLHPHPRSAAVICFGTGNTLGAASLHPLERLDGIELSREVVRAASLFAQTNHDVATSGKARIVIEDGRNYLLASDRRYDVITEEPPLVHTAGVVNLYSRDFYALAARRLSDDGIVAVWLATWELETRELQMLVRAFTDVFPYASVWDCTHPYEWVLIGSKRPLRVDLGTLAVRMASPAIARDLARIDPGTGGIRSPADLLSLHLLGRDAMVAFAADAPAVTDDRSVVDFTTPRHARANFGLGEWVTGGLPAAGVGERGLVSESGLRPFDRIYSFREAPSGLVTGYGAGDPAAFARELRERSWARELRAAQASVAALRRLAADLRTAGQPARSLEVVEGGLAGVPPEASGPLHAMRAQLLRELGRAQDALAADAEEQRARAALRARTPPGGAGGSLVAQPR